MLFQSKDLKAIESLVAESLKSEAGKGFVGFVFFS